MLYRVTFAGPSLSVMLISFLLAIPSIISQVHPWLGCLSASRPILGLRTPSVLTSTGVFASNVGTLPIPRIGAGGVLIATAAFLRYGKGKNAMATTFQALIADVFDQRQRPQATDALQSAYTEGTHAAFGPALGLMDLAAFAALSLLPRISVATFVSAKGDSREASYAAIA